MQVFFWIDDNAYSRYVPPTIEEPPSLLRFDRYVHEFVRFFGQVLLAKEETSKDMTGKR
jgi:hypothetical protein